MFVGFLRATGRVNELNSLYNGVPTPENYTWCIHAELIPSFHKLRAEGNILRGKFRKPVKQLNVDQHKTIIISGQPHQYVGEIDMKGFACGRGRATLKEYN